MGEWGCDARENLSPFRRITAECTPVSTVTVGAKTNWARYHGTPAGLYHSRAKHYCRPGNSPTFWCVHSLTLQLSVVTRLNVFSSEAMCNKDDKIFEVLLFHTTSTWKWSCHGELITKAIAVSEWSLASLKHDRQTVRTWLGMTSEFRWD